jgi:1,4-dihydroxy-2-naphthoyl-CoA synthase
VGSCSVVKVVPYEELESVIAERTDQICQTAPLAAAFIKRYTDRLIEDDDLGSYLNAVLMASLDAQEGAAVFKENRKPNWEHQ